jgi:uncharacterized membrane protein HdeD (DUF308 family)
MKAERARQHDAPEHINVTVFIDLDTLVRNWWVVLLRGIAGIIFGVLTFFWPEISFFALVLLFGAFAFADGVLAIISALRGGRTTDRWWLLLLQGLVGVAVGVLVVLWPNISALALIYLIGAWALITGGFEIAAAIRLRKVITREWLLILSGILSVALGVLLFLFPGAGALVLILWIGAYALVSGVLLSFLAFKLRSWGRSHRPRVASATA